MEVKPLGERVLLLPKGLNQGIVVEVGTDKDGNSLRLTHGELVLYSGTGHAIDVDGEKHLIVEYKDVLAKIE